MKKKFFLISGLLVFTLLFTTCKDTGSGDGILKFTLLQTSDLHSHAGGYGASIDYTPGDNTDNDGVLGGYTRIASLIAAIRNEQDEEDVPVVVVDSGDFFMGTVYDMAAVDPVSLKFFQMVGYDAITLGNHEFDWSPAGLALLLSNGITNGFNIPIIATNMVTSSASTADDGVETLVNAGAIVNKTVLELSNGLRIGLLGIVGPNADSQAPVAPPITFNHDYAFLQERVNDLRNNDGVDIVILLSHSGIRLDGTGDDADIADNVTGIDIIASGHYHTATSSSFQIGDTVIFSPGGYGRWLSRLDVTYDSDTGQVTAADFSLLPVDDTIVNRTVFETIVESYESAIDTALSPFGYTLDTPISRVSWDMETHGGSESGLGNLSADALRTIANNLAPLNDLNPYHVGVIPNGVIRDGLYSGKTGVVTFTDIYNALPLGTSPDTSQPMPGYPLMSMYLTAPDLRNAVEAGLTVSAMLGSDYYLNFSGIRVDYSPANAAILQGVRALYLCPFDDLFCTTKGPAIDLTDTVSLYHVVVDLYALQMLNAVTSIGLTIVPRDSAGNAIDPAEYMLHRIDSDITPGVQELKEWSALLFYLGNVFPASGNGIPSAIYGTGGLGMGRINIVN
jgi:5'-nucleotidase